MGRMIDADRLKEVFSRNVVGGNAYFDLIDNAPTVEAIPKDEYYARLKDDMEVMLEDLRLDFQEAELAGVFDNKELIFADEVDDLIKQKIDALKGDQAAG